MENERTTELKVYKKRLEAHRKRMLIRTGIGAGVAVVVIVALGLFFYFREYKNYKVVTKSEQEDTVATKYTELDGKIFKYGTDGASLLDNKEEMVWSSTYEMQNPQVDVCDATAVVYDKGSTSMAIYSSSGMTGLITTSMNIVKAKVAKQGVTAAILDGGEDTWINFYATDGSLIAENQTRVDDPGYPLDIAVSPDGELISVAYQFVDGSTTTSYVAFYNFGTAGQNQVDNIVSGFKYEGVVAPEVEYLDQSTSVAFRDDGFTIYTGKTIPKELKTVNVDKEIVSTFYDDEHIGLVFKNSGDEDKQYTMQVYNKKGKVDFETDFSIPYTSIKMTGGQVVMHNDSQICIVTGNGVTKYDGNLDEGTITDLFKIGFNRYVTVLDSGLCIIKLR